MLQAIVCFIGVVGEQSFIYAQVHHLACLQCGAQYAEHHFWHAMSALSCHHVTPSVQICAASCYHIHIVHAYLLLAD